MTKPARSAGGAAINCCSGSFEADLDAAGVPDHTAAWHRTSGPEMRDLPRSRQDALWLGVISPQNGHIVCARTSASRGMTIPNNFRNKSVMKTSRLRSTFARSPPAGRRGNKTAGEIGKTSRVSHFRQPMLTEHFMLP